MSDLDEQGWYSLLELRKQGVRIDEETKQPIDSGWLKHPHREMWKRWAPVTPKRGTMA